jgi:hypothetical protein
MVIVQRMILPAKNLNVLCYMELILVLPCLLPLLESVHKFIKITQGWDVFVCDLVEMYRLYCHSFIKFKDATFDDFNAIGNLRNATMSM